MDTTALAELIDRAQSASRPVHRGGNTHIHETEDYIAAFAALREAAARLRVVAGEPVAWQLRYIDPHEGPSLWSHLDASDVELMRCKSDFEIRPLYPQPATPATVTDEALVDSLRAGIMQCAAAEGCTHIVIKDAWVRAALESFANKETP